MKSPPGFYGLLLILFLVAESPETQELPQQEEGPDQVPRQVFVGDRGRLILNPGPGFEEVPPFTIDDARQLPQGQDLKLHRLELRRLRGVEWLLIDFTAFAPGRISLPPLNLPQMPGLNLESFEVNVASILEGDPGAGLSRQGGAVLALSGPASPLAAPGTAFLIYGTASLIVLILLLSLGMAVWGRSYLTAFLENHRRRRLVRFMGRVGKRLRERISPASCQELLREISTEFRTFLGYFFNPEAGGAGSFRQPEGRPLFPGTFSGGWNCRAMTATEFFSLPPLFPLPPDVCAASLPPWVELSSAQALGNFFRLLDRLRYSGEPAGPAEVAALIDRMDLILGAMDAGFRARIAGPPVQTEGL
ncbi:MAG: hypothetical protein LBD96_10295 [Treponema sp.]|jgi:hypothetical protein|nr:hypothetical protein [Treponema sp.]